jgi:hypothetical protein
MTFFNADEKYPDILSDSEPETKSNGTINDQLVSHGTPTGGRVQKNNK